MNQPMAPDLAAAIAKANDLSKRILPTQRDFFSACSLRVDVCVTGEARFLRVILHSYSLLYECALRPLRFCMRQTQFVPHCPDSQEYMDIIHALRTQVAHTLDLTRQRSEGLVKTSESFFLRHCSERYPYSESHWNQCSLAIEGHLYAIIDGVRTFLSEIEFRPGMDLMKTGIRRAVERGLNRADLEEIVQEVAKLYGREDIEPGRFVLKHYDVLCKEINSLPDDSNYTLAARKFIDQFVSIETESLPISGDDIIKLGVPVGREVGRLRNIALQHFQTGVRDRNELLRLVAAEIRL